MATRYRIPGRIFTIVFVIILAVVLWLGVSMALRFQRQLQLLADLRRVWPPLAAVLETRYRAVDDWLAQAGREAAIDPQRRAGWLANRATFQRSSQYDVQAKVVPPLEQWLREQEGLAEETLGNFAAASENLRKFIEIDQQLEALEQDWLGWLCGQTFRMQLPTRIHAWLQPLTSQ
jgi:hypothetical protein